MPFIRPKKMGKPPRPKPNRQDQGPGAVVSPEWGGTDLPDLRNPDIIPNVFGGRIEGNWSKPADPLDCERWPSSPYCDLASTFNPGKFFAVDVAVSVNLCGVSVEVNPTLAWISMPPAVVTWRSGSPECQPEPPEMDFPPRPGATFYRQVFGHWGCMYRVRATISYPTEISPVWETDGIWFDCWGPFEGYALHESPIQTPRGILYNLSPVFYAHGNAEYYPNYFSDPSFPNLRPTTQISFVIFRATATTTSPEHSIEFEYWEINESMPDRELTNSMASKIAYNRFYCRKPAPVPLLPFLGDEMCNCKQMEADLKAIKKLLGADKGGWQLPKSLAGRGTESVSHDNYADLMVWFAGQMSALLGDTEIVITQKDSSLLEEGNQERQLKFENLAEAMADALGLLLENQAKVDAIYRAAAQGLAQAGVAATSAAKGLEYLEDLVDFLDYETEEKSFDFPLFFTPDKDAPHEALKPSTTKLVYQAFTGKRSFNAFRFTMEQCAAIIRAVYWQRADDDSMRRFQQSMDGLRQSKKSEDGSDNDSDLDTYIESVEQGFPEVPGNVEQGQPYGAPYSQRPRIRKISKGGQPDGDNP